MFGQLAIAAAKDTVRDKMSMFWFIAFPLIFILLFGAIFSTDQEILVSVGLAIEDDGPLGDGIREAFKSIDAFVMHEGSIEDELAALKKGDRTVVVSVPKADAQSIMAGQPMEVPVYYDPARQTTAQVVVSSVNEILAEAERRITNAPRLLVAKPTKVQVKTLKTIDFLLPGILAMALMQLGLFGALGFATLREKKIIRRLGTTPLPRGYLLWSEIVIRIVMAVIQTLCIVVVGHLVYGVSVVGNWFAILGMVIVGASTFISLGYMLVSLSKTSESAQGLIQVVQFPMMFLSGIFFPVEIMPAFLRPVIKAIPLTYLGDALRHIMVGMASSYGILTDLAILVGWLVVTMALAVRLFKWD